MDLFIRVLISVSVMIICMSILLRVKLFSLGNMALLIVMSVVSTIVAMFNETLGGLLNIVILIAFLLLNKHSIVKSILIPLLVFLLMIISDFIVSSFVRSFFVFPMPYFEMIDSSLLLYTVLTASVAVIVFALAFLVSNIINKTRFNVLESKSYGILLVVYMLIAFAVVYTIVRTFDNTSEILNFGIYLICYLALAITMIIIYSSAKKDIKMKSKEIEQENLKRYTSELEVFINEINRVMHENNNIMLTMSHYIETNNMAELSDYFNEKIVTYKNRHAVNESNLKALSNILDPEIKSLIYCKLIQANEKELNPILEVFEEISFDTIDKIDLSRMIGILMDNAIEAASKSEEPEIRIALIKKDNNVLTIINNTCPKDMPSLHNIYKDKSSTKNKTGKGHGLENLKEIIAFYPNMFLQTELKEGIFSQCIRIDNIG